MSQQSKKAEKELFAKSVQLPKKQTKKQNEVTPEQTVSQGQNAEVSQGQSADQTACRDDDEALLQELVDVATADDGTIVGQNDGPVGPCNMGVSNLEGRVPIPEPPFCELPASETEDPNSSINSSKAEITRDPNDREGSPTKRSRTDYSNQSEQAAGMAGVEQGSLEETPNAGQEQPGVGDKGGEARTGYSVSAFSSQPVIGVNTFVKYTSFADKVRQVVPGKAPPKIEQTAVQAAMPDEAPPRQRVNPRAGVRLESRIRTKIMDFLKSELVKLNVQWEFFDTDLFAPTPHQRCAAGASIRSAEPYDLESVKNLARTAKTVWAMPGLWGCDGLGDKGVKEVWDTVLDSPVFSYGVLVTGADRTLDVSSAEQTQYLLPSFLKDAKAHPTFLGTATITRTANLKIFSPKPQEDFFFEQCDFDHWGRSHAGGPVPIQFHLFVRTQHAHTPAFVFANENEDLRSFSSSKVPPPLLDAGRVGFFSIRDSTFGPEFARNLSKSEQCLTIPAFGGNSFVSYPAHGEAHKKIIDSGLPFWENENQPLVRPGWYAVEIAPLGKNDLPKAALGNLMREKSLKRNIKLIISSGINRIKLFITRPSAINFPNWDELGAKHQVKIFATSPVRSPPIDCAERVMSEEHVTLVNIPYFISNSKLTEVLSDLTGSKIPNKEVSNDHTVPSRELTRAVHVFLPLTHTEAEAFAETLRETCGAQHATVRQKKVFEVLIDEEAEYWARIEREKTERESERSLGTQE